MGWFSAWMHKTKSSVHMRVECMKAARSSLFEGIELLVFQRQKEHYYA